MQPRIRVAVAGPQELFRAGIAALLAGQSGVEVVGEAGGGEDTVRLVLEHGPDVLLLDLDLPGSEALDAARRIRELSPRTEIVMLASQPAEAFQREAFDAGARGYLLRSAPLRSLLEAIRAASLGDYYLGEGAGRELLGDPLRAAGATARPGGWITARERQVACLLADGYSSKEAAAVLRISVKTVETHRTALMRKLGARNVTDIVKYCIRAGLLDL